MISVVLYILTWNFSVIEAVSMHMEKTTLRLFWTFMLACAFTVLTAIWFGERFGEAFTEAVMKTAATCFILGLANLLIWAPLMTYRFLYKKS